MKNMKKVFSLVLALVMMMALTVAAGATSVSSTVTPTITITNASKNVTYYAYKLFDAEVNDTKDEADPATGAGIAYYWNDANGAHVKTVEEITDGDVKALFRTTENTVGVFTMNNLGQISVVKGVEDADVTTAVAEWADAQAEASAAAHGTGEGGALTLTLTEYGYYAVTSDQSNAAVTVNSTTPTVSISDKTTVDVPEVPGNGKTITSTDASGEVITTYGLGDTVDYRLEIPTTNWVRHTVNGVMEEEFVYQYVLTDTATAGYLNIDTTSVTVKVKASGADDSTATALNSDHPATITRNATTGVMTITVPWGDQDSETSYYDNTSVIVVTYTATVTGTGKGENTLTAAYNTSDMNGSSMKEIHNISLSIDKHDSTDTNKKLAGATFALKNSEGKYYKYTPAPSDLTAETLAAWVESLWVDSLDAADKYTTDENGDLSDNFVGLVDGDTYTLVETEAPAGYNKMEDMDIVVGGNTTVNYVFDQSVANASGTELPSTGGIGTTIFTVTGGLLMIGAAILFLTKKRSEV